MDNFQPIQLGSVLIRQYNAIKDKYPNAVVLFRVNDYYQIFGNDAVRVSSIIGTVLTKKAYNDSYIELTGFPSDFLERYLHKLVRANCRIAVCDSL